MEALLVRSLSARAGLGHSRYKAYTTHSGIPHVSVVTLTLPTGSTRSLYGPKLQRHSL